MKGSLEIIKPGLMTSIQDLGRKGLAYYAIPQSGVMDENAARIALLLLGQDELNPILECTSIAPQILFHDSTDIAITGADFKWKINGNGVLRNSLLHMQKGDILKGAFANNGLRGYIAINGKLEADQVLNSYSTYANAKLGGYNGRYLKKGDVLFWSGVAREDNSKNIVPIHKGPEYEWLFEDSKEKLTSSSFKISSDTNRMGMRLTGPALESRSFQLSESVPVLPGFVQIPPNGQPIILLQDGQTTGGYPRIAYVRSSFLSKLNQFPLGSEIRFLLD